MMRRRRTGSAGFTILELMVAMGIFTILGSMVIVFMQQSLNIFSSGTRESAMFDRMGSALPTVTRDLQALYIGDQWDAPRPPPTEEQLLEGAKKPPPPKPPVIRLRSGYIKLKGEGGQLKDFLCPYFAFVTANAGWGDKQLRRAGDSMSKDAKPLSPEIVESDKDHVLLPVGGLQEIAWIAIPDDPQNPGILTLYRGYLSPVGRAETLLDPRNLDTLAKIRKACRPVQRGVIHFAAVWRRSFSDSFEASVVTGRGETDGYVGAVWDSTRGLDPKFPFYKKDSAGDPSDDIFPAHVRLEITLIAAGPFGYGRGELRLTEPLDAEGRELRVTDTTPLMAPGAGRSRYLKIGTEWVGYDLLSVESFERRLRVRRGQRGTKKIGHANGAWVYVGSSNETILELPFRDSYAIRKDGTR